MFKILSLGEILWDVFPSGKTLGGAPFNVALHFAQLGGQSCILSRTGVDGLGREAADESARRGVDVSYIQRDGERPTGTASVTLNAAGAAEYDIPFEVGYNYISVDDALISDINSRGFNVVCFGTMAQKGPVSRAAIRRVLDETETPLVFFDANFRLGFYPAEVLDYSLGKADIAKLNAEEADITSDLLFGKSLSRGDFAKRLMSRYNLECLLITLGGDGCEVFAGGGSACLPAAKVEIADTVGAGDAFSAGFVYKYLETGSAFSAAVFANAMGAYVSTKHGAAPLLDMNELLRLRRV